MYACLLKTNYYNGFHIVHKVRRRYGKPRRSSETSSPDESSSSESSEKDEPAPFNSRVVVNRKEKLSIKDEHSPVDQSILSPNSLANQNSTPLSSNHIRHTLNHIPPTPNLILHTSDQTPSDQHTIIRQHSDVFLNGTTQFSNCTKRPRGYSLKSDQQSKSTESEDINDKGTVNSKMKAFISTPIMPKHSK